MWGFLIVAYNLILFTISYLCLIWSIMICKGDIDVVDIDIRNNITDLELKECFQSSGNCMLHMCMIFFVMFLFNILIDIKFIFKLIINLYFAIFGFLVVVIKANNILKRYHPEEIQESEDEIAQIKCPSCEEFHDIDYPKCPFCKYDYYAEEH